MANSEENDGNSLTEVSANSHFSQTVAKLHQDLSKRFHVPDLARAAGLSIRSFHHCFKQEMGMTFVEFYHNLRMARAKELLAGDASNASSFAQASEVCLLPGETGCGISATLVKSKSNSAANGSGASSNDDGTELAGLVVLGTPVSAAPDPNTVIELPGIGFVILNEQFCDNEGTLANNCSDGTVLDHAGLTVRAIRLVVTAPDNPLGLETGQVIVAESHSDAAFKQ